MSNIIKELYDKGLASCGGHHWMPDNMHYITMMGSVAYGVSNDTSDTDIYSFCIPPKDNLFPHLRGEIVGFGDAKHANNRFRNHQQHHVKDVGAEKEYDLNVYNIVDYFQLVMENNPNMIDSLFTPQFCVLHSTRIGQMVREARKTFLHRGAWHAFKGYSYAQLKKMRPGEELVCPECEQISKGWHSKDNKFEVAYALMLDLWAALERDQGTLTDEELDKYCFYCAKSRKVSKLEKQKVNRRVGKRKESVEKYGFDPKFAYHVVRLLGEIEQILTEGDIDLQRNREQLKSIRRGEWTLEQIESYFADKEPQLETLYNENKAGLPWGPKDGDLQKNVKQLLFHCLEEHYGSLDKCVVNVDAAANALREIEGIVARYRKALA
jgi:predicted nucleotidyltransferase